MLGMPISLAASLVILLLTAFVSTASPMTPPDLLADGETTVAAIDSFALRGSGAERAADSEPRLLMIVGVSLLALGGAVRRMNRSGSLGCVARFCDVWFAFIRAPQPEYTPCGKAPSTGAAPGRRDASRDHREYQRERRSGGSPAK
jgi:hypothetical protein